MSAQHPILDGGNIPSGTLSGVPLGKTSDGEIFIKVGPTATDKVGIPALVAVKPNGDLTLLAADADGKLDVGLTFTGTVNVGEVSFDQTTPGTTNGVVVNSSALPAGAATQTTLAAALGELQTLTNDPVTGTAQAATTSAVNAVESAVASLQTLINTKLQVCKTDEVTVVSSALPSGAATAAKQPALGTAGTPSADVISVQGVSGGTAIPVSGTVTANAATGTLAASTAYTNGLVAKATAGRLLSLYVHNSGPTQFIQVHNATSAPADGAAPILLLAIPANSSIGISFGDVGLPCSTGIYVCNSTTGPTKTIGSANCYFTAVVI